MRTPYLLIIAILSFALLSCGNKPNQEANSQQDVELSDLELDHSAISGDIELENGQKWAVNEEMKPFILNGEQLILNYIANEDTDYEKLAKGLVTENGNLIRSCTMQGKSHEELHKWLNPHILLTEDLEDAESSETAIFIVKKLAESYQMYHNYFQ
ncbi:MAG: hypothetical protein LC107_12360 [Chitinophagales bacterium]|nr:hypothetical protein [Chitinophagales bacterium]